MPTFFFIFSKWNLENGFFQNGIWKILENGKQKYAHSKFEYARFIAWFIQFGKISGKIIFPKFFHFGSSEKIVHCKGLSRYPQE